MPSSRAGQRLGVDGSIADPFAGRWGKQPPATPIITEAKRLALPARSTAMPRPASFQARQAQRRPVFLSVISVTHRLSEAVPVSRPPPTCP